MSHDPLVGKVLADRFEILARIGEGGTGVVYKAKQLSVDRTVAIKLLGAHVSTDPQWVKRFHNEARAASRLTHPNTVQLIDFGQTKEGMLFIAMEFLHGTPLSGEIEKVGKLPPNRALNIIGQMCASLAEAHANGIIHRDIKPDNVFLVERPGGGDHVKVLDFSVAKMDTPDAQVTRAGMVFGTPSYMSPEQGRGAKLDARSDVYACGIVLYEMLSGKPPFDSRIPTEVVMMHLQKQPDPLVGVHPKAAAIAMKALAKDPNHRQQSATELEQECVACLGELGGRPTPGAGVPLVSSSAPPPGRPVANEEMKTVMGVEAPNLDALLRQNAADQQTRAAQPNPLPPPPASGGSSEQRTMMAQAPVLPTAQPPRANQEQRTVVAQPNPLHGAGGGPVPQASSEMKTMMGDMMAPVLPVAAPANPSSATPEQRTMMAQAPVLPAKEPARTVVAQPTAPAKGNSTVVLGEQAPAMPAPRSVAQPPPPKKGGGALFYMTWIILGAGLGMAAHYLLIPRLLFH